MTTDGQPSVSALPTFKGQVYRRDGSEEYAAHAYQYATTSRPADEMCPAVIVYVADDDDITSAIQYARANNLGIAVRSGGHQYIGSSSTNGNNIQLDLSGRAVADDPDKYKKYLYRQSSVNEAESSVTLGAGLCVDDVNDISTQYGIFFPHGECCGVHVGGHSQTGGFSVITPTFGVMIDYLLRFEIILADGTKRTVKYDSQDQMDKDLWFAVLGGSPGNFGVVTSITVKYLKDEKYPESRCFKQAWPFSADTMQELVQIINEVNDDPDRDTDLALSVMALGAEYDAETPWWDLVKEYLPETFDNEMMKKYPQLVGRDRFHWWAPAIVVYGAWTNSKGASQSRAYVEEVFHRLLQVEGRVPDWANDALNPSSPLQDGKEPMPISQTLKALTFENPREFNMSCKKLAWFGNNTRTMSQKREKLDGRTFAKWVADKVHELEGVENTIEFWGMKAAVQVGQLGGPGLLNPPIKTALAHRDCNYWFAFDVFYDPKVEHALDKTIAFTNDLAEKVMNNDVGLWEDGVERRLILGPMLVGNEKPVLDEMWKLYFDDEAVYDRLLTIKQQLDPDHVFTPNRFCVGATSCPRLTQ
jgi:FAD/FMN-containing dehydrogenase